MNASNLKAITIQICPHKNHKNVFTSSELMKYERRLLLTQLTELKHFPDEFSSILNSQSVNSCCKGLKITIFHIIMLRVTD